MASIHNYLKSKLTRPEFKSEVQLFWVGVKGELQYAHAFLTAESKRSTDDYKKLSREQRYQIYALMKAGLLQTEIAQVIGVLMSTNSRERRRNRGLRGYRQKQAQRFAEIRLAKAFTTRISPKTWLLGEHLLREDCSPEQIIEWFGRESQMMISHESITI